MAVVWKKIAYTEDVVPKNWLPGWDKRIKLTVDSGDIDGALSDFPVLVYLSAASGIGDVDVSAVFDELTEDGNRKKIAITTSDGITECYVEIEKWDDANEKAWLWVKVPSVASGSDTVLYLYYDKDHADNDDYVGDTNSTPAKNVWDANFKAVYHMADGADNAHIYDSTGNNNDGTKKAANEPVEADGQIGKAQTFDGTNQIDCDGDASLHSITGDLTLEAVVKKTADSGDTTIIGTRYGRNDWTSPYNLYVMGPANTPRFWMGKGDGVLTAASSVGVVIDEWTYVASTIEGDDMIIQVNLAETGNETFTGNRQTGLKLTLGAYDIAAGRPFIGIIDEVRISDTFRTLAWRKATKKSLWDSLLAFGSEETWAFHHAAFHEAGGDDEISLAGLLGETAELGTHKANTTTAHGAVSAATANKIVVRDAQGQAKFAAPAEAGDALIKGTRITTDELPAMTDEKYWVGTGGNVEERDVPTGGATLTVAETEVFSGTSPTVWTDLNLSAVVGANHALVLLKVVNASLTIGFVAVRKNGDTDEFGDSTYTYKAGAAQAYVDAKEHKVLLVATDASGIIEWRAQGARAGTTIDVIAYIK